MEMDITTLNDLELFGSAEGDAGLFGLIDRTDTTPGRLALHRRLEEPSSDVASIRRTQDAVRFFHAHPRSLTLDDAEVEGTSRYLESNIQVSSSSSLGARAEYAWMSLRYRDLLKELSEGVRVTGLLFGRVGHVCSTLEALSPPDEVAELVRRLDATGRSVMAAVEDAATLLEADRRLRHGLAEEIRDALDLLGQLDALRAMADATAALGWVMPDVVESDAFEMDVEGVVHPAVEDAVGNPVRLTGGEPMVFLTGPNMAGKTTYLRSVALVVVLGQAGMGVPARRARFTPVDTVFTSLNPADNLRAGLSYFLAEVMRVKAAAELLARGRKALVLFDEVFKGTNVRDALDASAQVIVGFARARRSGFIFSSHLAELVEVLESHPAIRFCCFDGDIVDGVPMYSYRLSDGVSEKRFGLLLLRQARVPELLERIPAASGA